METPHVGSKQTSTADERTARQARQILGNFRDPYKATGGGGERQLAYALSGGGVAIDFRQEAA